MTSVRMFRTLGLTAALAAVAGLGTAQAQTVNWDPRTGDVWVDTWLGDINRYGDRYREPFVDEMVRYYGAPRDLVTSLLLERDWEPGDVYYACAVAQTIGRPCRYVADEWERDGRGEGWGVTAQRLGIKPGSPEFHRLKSGFVSSYDRWGRPIRIDDDLFDDYPERASLMREGRDDANWRRSDDRRFDDRDRGRPAQAGRGNDGGNGRGNNGRGNDNAPGNSGNRANANANRGNDAAGNRGNRGNQGQGQGQGNRGNDKGNKGNSGNDKGNKGKGNDKGNGRGG